MKEYIEYRFSSSRQDLDLSRLGKFQWKQDKSDRRPPWLATIRLSARSEERKEFEDFFLREQRAGDLGFHNEGRYFQATTESERSKSPFLVAYFNKFFRYSAIEGGTTFSTDELCPICNRGWNQLSNLKFEVNLKTESSFFETMGGTNQALAPMEFASAVIEHGITGTQTRPIEFPNRQRKSNNWDTSSQLLQLVVKGSFDIADDELNWRGFLGKPMSRCPVDGTWLGHRLGPVFLDSRFTCSSDVALSSQWFGKVRFVGELAQPSQAMLVSQKFYRLYIARGWSGLRFELPLFV